MNNKQFLNLVNMEGDHLVSIYLSTHRYGQDVNEKKDALQLKNLIKELETKLPEKGVPQKHLEKFLSPVRELLDDNAFWHSQLEGLVILLADGFMEKYILPINVRTSVYLGSYFHLSPLIPLFNDNGQFYLLKITKSNIKLYLCTRFSIWEVMFDKDFPDTMDKALSWYDRDVNTRMRSGHAGANPVLQGQGLVKEDEIIKLRKFYEKFDAQVQKVIENKNIPMVLAGLDHLTSLYKEASKYPFLLEKTYHSDPNAVDIKELHKEAFEIAREKLIASQYKAYGRFQKLAGTEKTSVDIKKIVSSAFYKDIDALFIAEDEEVWGTTDDDKLKIEIHREYREDDENLINTSIIHTLRNGGEVYIVRKDEMPVPGVEMAALLRAGVEVSVM